MVKTVDCGSTMRGFESHHPPHLQNRLLEGCFLLIVLFHIIWYLYYFWYFQNCRQFWNYRQKACKYWIFTWKKSQELKFRNYLKLLILQTVLEFFVFWHYIMVSAICTVLQLFLEFRAVWVLILKLVVSILNPVKIFFKLGSRFFLFKIFYSFNIGIFFI